MSAVVPNPKNNRLENFNMPVQDQHQPMNLEQLAQLPPVADEPGAHEDYQAVVDRAEPDSTLRKILGQAVGLLGAISVVLITRDIGLHKQIPAASSNDLLISGIATIASIALFALGGYAYDALKPNQPSAPPLDQLNQ